MRLSLLFPAALVALAGGQQDPYEMINLGDGGLPDTRSPDTGPTCTPTNGGVEICDGVDNDCNGAADDPFNLQVDPENCGKCGVSCILPGALTICELGKCKYLGCAPGFHDMNKDQKDGCEYPCVATGAELCDGKDNDCNGKTDETFDLQTDVDNCGACGNACQLANAVVKCEGGTCKIQQCKTGFIDKDKNDQNGCEEPCTLSNGGTELCDGKDNDCNGVVDDPGGVPIDFKTDKLNCGACNVVCGLPNAVVECQNSACVVTGCVGQHKDADGDPANGCECLPDGVEICDGKDNDCNGTADDGLTALGACGSSTGECQQGTLQCIGGSPTCVGDVGPKPEECNGKDDDCDGTPDDNLPSFGVCGSGVGECQQGTLQCQGGKQVCVGEVGPGTEVCNGKDDDCNGTPDDNLAGIPGVCGTNQGECVAGTLLCQAGGLVCLGKKDPEQEMCDGKDNDCNGQNDPPACVFGGANRETRLDEPGVSTPGAHNSTQLHIAGKGERILAVWLDRRNDRGDVFGNVSFDSGKTWKTSDIAVAAETESAVEPQVAFGGPATLASYRAYVVYERYTSGGQRDVYLRRSLDDGLTWSSPVALETTAEDALFVRVATRPGAAPSNQDTVVVCWETIGTSKPPVNPNVRCTISTDSGQTFAVVKTANGTVNNAFVPQIAVDQSYVYVAWQQGDTIRAARSALSSPLSFVNETLLSPHPGRDPRIAADGTGTVLVAWVDTRDPLLNIRANRSTSSGQTWLSDGVRVDKDVVNGDSIQPAIAMRPGGRVFVAWADTVRGKHDIYTNFSDDGGQTWGVVASRVTAGTPGSATSENPAIAVSPAGNNVYVAWEDLRNGVKRDIYASVSIDNGVTWNEPDWRINESTPAGAVATRSPFVWAGSSRAAVLWIDNRTGSAGSMTTGANSDIYCSYLE